MPELHRSAACLQQRSRPQWKCLRKRSFEVASTVSDEGRRVHCCSCSRVLSPDFYSFFMKKTSWSLKPSRDSYRWRVFLKVQPSPASVFFALHCVTFLCVYREARDEWASVISAGIYKEVIKAPRGVLIYSWYVGSGTQTKGRHFCSLFSGRLVMLHVWSIISTPFFCYPHINASLILIGPRVAVDYSVDCMRASSLPPLCHVAVQHHTHAAPTPASAASAHSWAQAAS